MSRASAAKTRSNGSKRRLAREALGAAEDDAAIGALRTVSSSRPSRLRGSAIRTSSTCRPDARLSELASEAERLSGEESLARDAWTATTAEWAALAALGGPGRSRLAALRAGGRRAHQRAEEQHAAEERTLRQQLQRIEQLIERAQKRSTAEDLTLREAERLSRDLRGAIEARRRSKRNSRQLLERLKAAATAIAPRVHDLREMDEWKRFANAAVQEELIAKAEALRARFGFDAPEGPKEEDLDKAARELHDIQERWKSVAEAPRAQAQALWHRYRQAADPIQARLREFFSHRNEERKGNLEKKLALICAPKRWPTPPTGSRRPTSWKKAGRVAADRRCRARKRAPRGSSSAKHATASSPRRNADLAERKETWTANSPARKRCAPAPRSSRRRGNGTARRRKSAGCRPTGRPSARAPQQV